MFRSRETDNIEEQLASNIKHRDKQQRINRRIRYSKQYQTEMMKKRQKKYIYGRFFNYDIIKFNKEKKYMMQQEKNTQIQRQNRVLFEKLQTIKRRSQQRINKLHTSAQVSQKSLPKHRIPTQSYDIIKNVKFQLPILASKVILFEGKRLINYEICKIIIFTTHDKYVIEVQRDNVQQKIEIPLNQYKIFVRQTLKGRHESIFNYLKINQLGYLQLKGVSRIQTQTREGQFNN